MAVRDNGIETLKKSAELVNKNSLADMYFKVKEYFRPKDALQTSVTTLTTTSSKINTPSDCQDFIIFTEDTNGFYLVIDGQTILINDGDVVELTEMKSGNDNNISGKSVTGTAIVQVIGAIRQ